MDLKAPRCWNKRFEAFLIKQGFKVSAADPCLYVRYRDGKKLLLALYVDDGLLAATDIQELNSLNSLVKAPETNTSESGKIDTSFPYRQAVGALMFLITGTRPHLAYSVGYLSRKLDKPTTDDVIKLKRKGVVYKPDCSSGPLQCFSDADFAGCTATGRSNSDVVVCHAGGAVSWLSQRQDGCNVYY